MVTATARLGSVEVKTELLSWYAEHGRDLPWRRTRDPYAVLVSEVMLQQTHLSDEDPAPYALLVSAAAESESPEETGIAPSRQLGVRTVFAEPLWRLLTMSIWTSYLLTPMAPEPGLTAPAY